MSESKITPKKTDEIDLSEIWKQFLAFLKSTFRALFQTIGFFHRKKYIIIGLILSGIALGFIYTNWIDKQSNHYKKEIIIEPNFNSTSFVYNTIEEMDESIEDKKGPFKELGVSKADWEKIFDIKMTPLFSIEEIYPMKNEDVGKGMLFKNIKEFEYEKLMQPEYRDLYSKHKLEIYLSDTVNSKIISQSILNYILGNKYFEGLGKVIIDNLNNRMKLNDRSITFIDSYLQRLEKGEQLEKSSNDQLIFLNDDNTPNVAAILAEKAELLKEREFIQTHLDVHNSVIRVVSESEAVKEKTKLFDNLIFLIPLFLLAVFCGYHLLRYILKEAYQFAHN